MSIFTKIGDWFDEVLIPEWRQAYKFLSVQLSTIFTTAVVVWLSLPEEQKASILEIIGVNGASTLALVSFVMIVIARLKSQPNLPQ